DQVVDTDVMLDATRQQLILNLDGGETRRLGERNRPVDVRRITPAAARVENDWEPAHGTDIKGDFGHLRQRDVRLGDAFEPTERAAAHVDRLEACILGNPRHDWIERTGGDDQLMALDKFSKIRQKLPPSFSP